MPSRGSKPNLSVYNFLGTILDSNGDYGCKYWEFDTYKVSLLLLFSLI